MKALFVEPEVSVIVLEQSDVITASGEKNTHELPPIIFH